MYKGKDRRKKERRKMGRSVILDISLSDFVLLFARNKQSGISIFKTIRQRKILD